MNPVVIGDATLYLGDCLEILPTLGKIEVFSRSERIHAMMASLASR